MSQLEFFLLATLPFVALGALTWRLVWPSWKLAGKPLFYFGVAWLLWSWGPWTLTLLYAHQLIGLAIHIWFCRRHGFAWWWVEDPRAYAEASRRWVRGPRSTRC